MAKRAKQRTKSRNSSRSKAGKYRWLQIVLQFLVVLLVLSGIALAASYVYQQTTYKSTKIAEAASKNPQVATQSPAADTALLGIWINSDNGTMLTIENKKFSLDFSSVEAEKPLSGKISFASQTFTVSDSKHAGCENSNGTYEYTIKGSDLIISAINDSCAKRRRQLEASWYKM